MEASAAFGELSRLVYRELRDVSSMVALGNAGTRFALSNARSSKSSADAGKLIKYAKTLAFNTAANCWPGWGDEGVSILEDHLRAGQKLAELSRDLVVELNLGNKERGTSHWLVGALRLARGHHAEALAEFQLAKEFHAGEPDYVLLAEGYIALALKAQSASRTAGVNELTRVLELLKSQSSKESQFFANQLITANRLLISPTE
jgi:hypothetical protein